MYELSLPILSIWVIRYLYLDTQYRTIYTVPCRVSYSVILPNVADVGQF